MRILRVALCIILVALLGTQPALAALPRLGILSSDSQTVNAYTVDSTLMVNPDLTDAEAAERLYYLGFMSGVGTRDGFVNFALDRPLTRLECIVMTARLLGVAAEVPAFGDLHPFSDVPAWGSAYVSYFWENGLIVADEAHPSLFEPDAEVSTNYLMKYMLYAMG